MINSYRRHAMLFGIVAAVVAILVSLALILQPASYTGSALVLMVSNSDVQATPTLPGQPATPQQSQNDAVLSSYVDTQVAVIQSHDLVGLVVDQFNLASDPQFVPASMLGDHTPQGKINARETAITSVINNHLKARRSGQSYVVSIDFTDHDPNKAAQVANAFAQTFIRQQLQLKVQAAKTANDLLNAQLASMRDEVERDAQAVANYEAAHNLVNTTSQGNILSQGEISALTEQLAQTRAAQAEADANLSTAKAQLAKGSSGGDVGDALSSPVVQNLREQRAVVSAHLANLQASLGARHPDVITAKGQLADIDAQISAEIQRIISNLRAQAQVAAGRTASVLSSLNEAQASLVTSNSASVELGELQRNADSSKEIYESYLAKAKQTAQQQTISQPDAQIASVAQPPIKPSSPIIPLDILVGLVLGLGAGVGAVVVRRMMDSTLRTQDDVETRLGVPYLAGIPTLASSVKKPETNSPIEAVVKHPLSGFAEAFRALATAVTLGEHDVKVLAITSSLPNEGKTTTSICLAEILTLAGSRVLVIDCDLRRRSLNAALGANVKTGLLEVLSGKMTLSEALYVDERTRTHFLLLPKTASATAKSPLESPAFDALLAQTKEVYDYVILDFPPLLPIVDARVLAPKADAVILLCRWQQTPKRAVQHAIRLLQDVGVEPAGVALSLVDLKAQQRYGYGDAGYYYANYSDYYLSGKT